ncbi:unnamed protein product, partial [Mesorhabditis belari]|uniref:Uncharacterized protein n=1 Tax=Mesorhabditis belari TaxID=2138241 RepID=A0AAF3J800_9BILA
MKPRWNIAVISDLFLLFSIVLISTISGCQIGCRCPNRETADCSGSGFRTVPILLDPRTTKLSLDNNRIQKITADELSIYPGLLSLSLSNNSIVHLSNEVFSSLSFLETLDLSANKILTLPPKVFGKLGKLKHLDLSRNGVQLSADILHGLHSLEELKLSANGLSYLPPSVFRHSPSLCRLNLDSNRLIDLPRSVLSSIPKLKSLDAHSNLLSNLESGTFGDLSSLEALDLSDNMIANIDDGGLTGLDALLLLNLTNNQLVRLPGNTWPLPNLRTLDLSGNLFVALETASFDNLPSLQNLNLSMSRNLKSIHMSAFVSLNSLRWLSMSNSQLASISNTAFAPPPLLNHLDLSNNQLYSLPSAALPWQRIRSLNLAGNPWECDCALREMELKGANAICSGPQSQAAMPVSTLSPCSPLRGLVLPLLLGILVLLLAIVTLLLAVRRPRPRKHSDPLLQTSSSLFVSQDKYGFDRPFISPPSSASPHSPHSPQSQESYYEAPNTKHLPYAPSYRPSLYGQLPPSYSSSRTLLVGSNSYKQIYRPPPLTAPPPIPQVIPPLGQGGYLERRDSGVYENGHEHEERIGHNRLSNEIEIEQSKQASKAISPSTRL